MTKRAAHRKLTELPRSGDVLADWMFRQFVTVLRSRRVRISRKKRLMNPDDPLRRVIRGLTDPDIHPSGKWVQILINPSKNTNRDRGEEVETLIHELTHIIMPRTGEQSILAVENILSRQFSPSQLRYLKTFIPKHQVKRYPHAGLLGRVVVV